MSDPAAKKKAAMSPEPVQQQAPPRRRNRPETSDVAGTVILGVVGLVAVVMGLGYGFTTETGQVGPGFLPVLTGGFIVVATLLELARMFFATSSPVEGSFMEQIEKVEEDAREAIARAHAHDGAAEGAGSERDTFGRTRQQRGIAIASIFGLMLVVLLLVPVLGLLISLTLMTLVLLLVVERKPVLPSVLATAAGLAFFYLIFVQGLNIPLPTGMLGLI